MRRGFAYAIVIGLALAPVAGFGQSRDETLADIRQQLTVLYVDIQRLKRELSTTGAPGGVTAGASTLERLDAIEQQVKNLTGRTEQLEFRVQRIVDDGTNRIGDLEFRLVELEGGDLSALGETTTLGGDVEEVPSFGTPDTGSGDSTGSELAVGESADFGRARQALDNADFQSAVDQFAGFVDTYPGSPLEEEAHLRRGQALEGLNENTRAARAFLAAYSGDPQGPVAAESLYHLGRSLAVLGQINEACVTLNEVGVRYPGTPQVSQANAEIARLQCP
nr:tol-pal system protein YbgF [Shimia abyssi]